MKYLLIGLAALSLSAPSLAAPAIPEAQTLPQLETLDLQNPILLAKRKGKKKKGRARHLVGEAKAKGGKTRIDFDEASIDGARRAPIGQEIRKNKKNHEYDLINLRLRWHDEMIESTRRLQTGRGR